VKLLQTNLYDPEPNKEDYHIMQVENNSTQEPKGAYKEDLEEWKKRQVKPEFEDWKNFNEEFPKIKTKIYVIHRSDLEKDRHPHTLANVGVFDRWVRTMDDVSYEDEDWIWTYAESYDKKYQYYEQHRLKYEGFEYLEEDGIELSHKESGLTIFIEEDRPEWILTTGKKRGFNLIFDEGLSQSLFTQICQENGIKLKEI
jgi:hypothetical protein